MPNEQPPPSCENYGTEHYPIRCSSIPALLRCPLRNLMLHLDLVPDNAGEAADTGSATHKAVAAWHERKDITAAIKVMRECIIEYPLANLDEAAEMFQDYAGDPRNQAAKVVLCEKQITFQLDPSERDETRQKILVQGTLDQVREEHGVYRLYDLKTGKPDGGEMVQDHTMQIAAYCIGASQHLRKPVEPGAIIRVRGYRSRTGNVFFPFKWTLAHANLLMDGLREMVAMIRSGNVYLNPGKYCYYCPAMGVERCTQQLLQLTVNGV